MNKNISKIVIDGDEYGVIDEETKTSVETLKNQVDELIAIGDVENSNKIVNDINEHIDEKISTLETKIDNISTGGGVTNSYSCLGNLLINIFSYNGFAFCADSYSSDIALISFSNVLIRDLNVTLEAHYNEYYAYNFGSTIITKIDNISSTSSSYETGAFSSSKSYLYFNKHYFYLADKTKTGTIEGQFVTEFGAIPICIQIYPDNNE